MICAIVLAAGKSSRMGANKLLLPYGEETVIGHIVRTVFDSRVDRTYVVVGHEGDRISEDLAQYQVPIVYNPEFEAGMLSSVRCGVSALPDECLATLLVLGDQPSLTTHVINGLIDALSKSEKGILVPVYEGSRGHPLLFSTRYSQEILIHYEDEGLRGLLQAHPEDVEELEVSVSAILRDMDRPEDYSREIDLRQRAPV